MRASRLLSLLLLLQTRGRMTAQELADELEVSVRTIYRDVDSLSASGVPVYSDRGPAGGYQLLDGYRTRLTGLTSGEAETLFLAGIPGPAAELGLGAVLAAAQLKLLAALPPELRSRAGRIRERFHLDAPGWFQESEETPHLATVADAVWNQRRLRVRYHRWGGDVSRTLEPLGVVLKAGAWYLAAAVDQSVRTYRVSRILELEVLEERFERPLTFDLGEFWNGYSARFHTDVYAGRAQVRLSPRGVRMLDMLGPVTARTARESAGEPDRRGWVEASVPIASVNQGEVELLRLGAEAEVLAPEDLRERMVEAAAALIKVYGAEPADSDERRRPMRMIGLLGGMSWESTAVYYRVLNEEVRDTLGGLASAPIVMWSVDFAEIEALQVAGRWTEAGLLLARAARRLQDAGARLIILCTNTMHIVADVVERAVEVPFIHIADPTAAAIRRQGLSRVGLLATAYTMEEEFYIGRLRDRHGIEVRVPDAADRAAVHRVIYEELCVGIVREESRELYRRVIRDLVAGGAEAIIFGCTEIGLLVSQADSPIPVFDTTLLHAQAAVALSLTGVAVGAHG